MVGPKTMIIMRDSTNPEEIPTDTPVVAGYADGFYEWDQTDWDRFPNAIKLTIATNANTEADILDVENGDATPSQAVEWCNRFNRPSRERPTIYCNRSTWPTVQSLLAGHVVDYWISTLDGTESVDGAVAVQYKDVQTYDQSAINDYEWAYGKMNAQILDMIIKGWYRFPPMNRDPEQSEVDYWVNRILGGINPEQAMDEFVGSTEYQEKLATLMGSKT